MFHFTKSGDRKIVFVLLIFHGFVWISPPAVQMNTK